MVAETPEELQLLHDKQAIEAEAGLETHVLEGEELRRFAPYLAADLLGATYCPDEGHANPFLAAPLVRAARGRARRRHPHAASRSRGGRPGRSSSRTSRGRGAGAGASSTPPAPGPTSSRR